MRHVRSGVTPIEVEADVVDWSGSGHGLQGRLGVTGTRNRLIPVTANFDR
jgi:hypothetical protein